jgi:DNA polymerase elongation subunit (family B)
MNYFDIETGPLPTAELETMMPAFEAPKNLKDPVKIAAAIAEKRADWLSDAALHPETGRVLAIGLWTVDHGYAAYTWEDEAQLLTHFWQTLTATYHTQRWAGWNICDFDLPFLVRRSWILGAPVPPWLRDGRYWSKYLVDLMEVYGCCTRELISLKTAARALRAGTKSGRGSEFARLFHEDRPKALEYLRNDIELTRRVGDRILG